MKSSNDTPALDRLYKYSIYSFIIALALAGVLAFFEKRIEIISGFTLPLFGIMLILSGIFALGTISIFTFSKLSKQ